MAQHQINIENLHKFREHDGSLNNGLLLFNYMAVANECNPTGDDYEKAEEIARYQHKNNKGANKHLKSTICATHCFTCPKCNWSCGGKPAKTMTLLVRLHKKKCKC
jgi:hypothetical protein|tara:strand:- start:93 stop:410 length:318 start_codon:yes stop_codon:yes gene_type:complete